MTQELNTTVHRLALQIGFDACGIVAPTSLTPEAHRLQEWLRNGYHADMSYLCRHAEKREDPRLLVKDVASIVVTLSSYNRLENQAPGLPRIARYAQGRDYHLILKEKLHELLSEIQHRDPACHGRVFVDSAPVLERALAVRAGLGWIGKNTLLIHPELGSFTLIGILMLTAPIQPDPTTPQANRCGTCTRCLEACPTGAIHTGGLLNANRCFSYHTIENRGPIPESLRDRIGERLFGCDTCQEKCPWNQQARIPANPLLKPRDATLAYTTQAWREMTPEKFAQIFGDTPLFRTGLLKLQETLQAHKITTP